MKLPITGRLKMLIEDTYNHSGSKVVLVSHSLGGLTTSTFLHTMSQQWKDQYVHAWVSAAGVFGGAVKVLETLGSRHFKLLSNTENSSMIL